MPQSLPLPAAVTGRARHCVALNFVLPVGGAPSASAGFVIREGLDNGGTRDVDDGSVTITAEEIMALPAFPDAYQQLAALVHAKRAAYD